jgi:hypothetical protein
MFNIFAINTPRWKIFGSVDSSKQEETPNPSQRMQATKPQRTTNKQPKKLLRASFQKTREDMVATPNSVRAQPLEVQTCIRYLEIIGNH